MTTRDKLFGFRGRIRRQDWWMLGLLVGIAQIVVSFALVSVVSVAHLSPTAEPMGPFEALAIVPVYIKLPIQLAFLWPSLALSVQRYHDRGSSAWPLLIYYVVAFGADHVPGFMTAWTSGLDPTVMEVLSFVWAGAFILLGLWFFITLGFMDGTKGPNRFGPSPKGAGDTPLATFE